MTYQAKRELNRIATLAAFNVCGDAKRDKLNQHSTLYLFADESRLQIDHTRRRASCWHVEWTGQEHDTHLAPIRNLPILVNARGAA